MIGEPLSGSEIERVYPGVGEAAVPDEAEDIVGEIGEGEQQAGAEGNARQYKELDVFGVEFFKKDVGVTGEKSKIGNGELDEVGSGDAVANLTG